MKDNLVLTWFTVAVTLQQLIFLILKSSTIYWLHLNDKIKDEIMFYPVFWDITSSKFFNLLSNFNVNYSYQVW